MSAVSGHVSTTNRLCASTSSKDGERHVHVEAQPQDRRTGRVQPRACRTRDTCERPRARSTQSHDPDLFARKGESFELGPVAAAHLGIDQVVTAREQQDVGERRVCDLVAEDGRRVPHDDAQVGRRRVIHGVHPDPPPDQYAQVRRGPEHICRERSSPAIMPTTPGTAP